jgi:hypothetical protein
VRSDSGAIVLGWLTKLVVMFTFFGVLLFDGIAIMAATFGAADDATFASAMAADNYRTTASVQQAYDAAVSALDGKPSTVQTEDFTITSSGAVHLTVVREPATLWLHYIGPLKHFGVVSQSGVGTAQLP